MLGTLKSNSVQAPANDFPKAGNTETLAAIGQMASKVAHELNNPLDGIIRYISLAQRKIKAGRADGVERYLDDAQFGLQRMAEVLRELLDLGRQAIPASPTIPLHYVIEQSVQTLQPLAEAHRVAIHRDLATIESLSVPANLFQVLTNLLKNSLDAMPTGGNVFIRAALDGPAGQPERLIIQIRDTGPGIPEADLPHIFEPFFSRKPPTAEALGTGLGLAITKEILERIGAAIAVENLAPQAGCQFTLGIPLTSYINRGRP